VKLNVQNHVKCVKVQCVLLVSSLLLLLTPTEIKAETPYDVKQQSSDLVKPVFRVSDFNSLSNDELYFAELAVYSCSCAIRTEKRKNMALRNAKRLLIVEKGVGIPDKMRGMTLAAACHESCYNEFAQGDHKFSKKGKPKAIGIMQLWPWVKKYGVNRNNLESSAEFWLKHIIRQRSKIKCKSRTELTAWRQAWVTAVRAPKKGRRCREIPKHWKPFLKLRKIRNIINEDVSEMQCLLQGP